MQFHCFQHVPFEDLGNIKDWLRDRHHNLSYTRFWQNDQIPSLDEIDGLIVMGGPMGVFDDQLYPWLNDEKKFIKEAIEAGKKVIGICLGAQLIAHVLGARVFKNKQSEIGWYPVFRECDSHQNNAIKCIPDGLIVFHWHNDTFDLPEQSYRLCFSERCTNQGFIYKTNALALQFHLEMTEESLKSIYENCKSDLTTQTQEDILNFSHMKFNQRILNNMFDYFTEL